MEFKLTPDHEAIIADVRAFAKKEIAPFAAEIDAESKFPAEIIKKMAELGYMGINIPEEYGGAGLDDVYKVLVVREIAKCCASTAEILAVQSLVNDILVTKGTKEQKEKYLPMVAEGRIGAFALTEAGSRFRRQRRENKGRIRRRQLYNQRLKMLHKQYGSRRRRLCNTYRPYGPFGGSKGNERHYS